MKHERGFSLVLAIFILVVLGLLGTYMVRLSGVQQTTAVYALQRARAYLSAKAGLDWAVVRINKGANCAEIKAETSLKFPDMAGFSVTLSCFSAHYREGRSDIDTYQLAALSQYGSYDSLDYVARRLETSVLLASKVNIDDRR